MGLSSLFTLGLRQTIDYTERCTIYRPIMQSAGKWLYAIATQLNSANVAVPLVEVPCLFEPTKNTDQFAGVVGDEKDSNLITLNPLFVPAAVDIRDNDRVLMLSPYWQLPWFAVNGEPKVRPNQGLRTPNYALVLLDPATPPPLVS
jgi:hypothetical protein